jgi:hypothetical protein
LAKYAYCIQIDQAKFVLETHELPSKTLLGVRPISGNHAAGVRSEIPQAEQAIWLEGSKAARE